MARTFQVTTAVDFGKYDDGFAGAEVRAVKAMPVAPAWLMLTRGTVVKTALG
ncbi:hypothetical protein [Streptomyces sp. NPDC002889]|uniref:hypothetical protein n=1 Tax=Streptomyces sp. NPDC002889 TaxID=3364669 RepID=UPI0036C36FDD